MRKIDRAIVPRPERLRSGNLTLQLDQIRGHFEVERQQRVRRRAPYDREVVHHVEVIHTLKDPPMRRALQSIDWSATLFTKPGLFHYELGWPNQP